MLLGLPGAVQAQVLIGADLGVGYQLAPGTSDIGGLSYTAGAELGLPYNLALAVDYAAYDFDFSGSDKSNLTGHAIYFLSAATQLGFFYAEDTSGAALGPLQGIEAAHDYDYGRFEGYFASAQLTSGADVTLYGAEASYLLSPEIDVLAGLDGFDGDGSGTQGIELTARYRPDGGPVFGLSLGQLNRDQAGGSRQDWVIGIGASVGIGTTGGTTFGARSAFAVARQGTPGG